ncbi:MAG: hypothetical protein ACKOKC_09310 [Chthoniobacterales bacterium]
MDTDPALKHLLTLLEGSGDEDIRLHDPQLQSLNKPLATILRIIRSGGDKLAAALARAVKFRKAGSFTLRDARQVPAQFAAFCKTQQAMKGLRFAAAEPRTDLPSFKEAWIYPASISSGVCLALRVKLYEDSTSKSITVTTDVVDAGKLRGMPWQLDFKIDKHRWSQELYETGARRYSNSCGTDLLLRDERLRQAVIPKLLPLMFYPSVNSKAMVLGKYFEEYHVNIGATNVRAHINRMQIKEIAKPRPAKPKRR